MSRFHRSTETAHRPPPLQPTLPFGFSREAERQGRPREARKHAMQAHDLYQAAGHLTGRANALNSIGWCHGHLGEYHQARTACEQALALAQQLGDRWVRAAVWDSLGYAHTETAQINTVLQAFGEPAVGIPGRGGIQLRPGRLEQLHRVARRVVQQDLPAAGAGDDVVAEHQPGGA
jgi:tetratricopeptide (TPR) repeat protein